MKPILPQEKQTGPPSGLNDMVWAMVGVFRRGGEEIDGAERLGCKWKCLLLRSQHVWECEEAEDEAEGEESEGEKAKMRWRKVRSRKVRSEDEKADDEKDVEQG